MTGAAQFFQTAVVDELAANSVLNFWLTGHRGTQDAHVGVNLVSYAAGRVQRSADGSVRATGQQVFNDRLWRCEDLAGLPFDPRRADSLEVVLRLRERSVERVDFGVPFLQTERYLTAQLVLLSWGGAPGEEFELTLDAGSSVLFGGIGEEFYSLSVRSLGEPG